MFETGLLTTQNLLTLLGGMVIGWVILGAILRRR